MGKIDVLRKNKPEIRNWRGKNRTRIPLQEVLQDESRQLTRFDGKILHWTKKKIYRFQCVRERKRQNEEENEREGKEWEKGVRTKNEKKDSKQMEMILSWKIK